MAADPETTAAPEYDAEEQAMLDRGVLPGAVDLCRRLRLIDADIQKVNAALRELQTTPDHKEPER